MTLLLKETLEQRILRIADQLQPEIQRTFLDAVAALKRAVPIGELSDLFDAGDISGALEALAGVTLSPADLEGITDAILQTTLGTAELAAVDLNLEFALVNERAVRWATEEAKLLQGVVDAETNKAIRDIVVRGQREGLNVRLQAQQIRRVVGLTDRDARAVDRFYEGIRQSGATEARAKELADRMSARLLRRRAENIARTETIRAANMGNQLSWQTAIDRGLLPPDTQKIWIATQDARVCPICAVLDGQVIAVSEPFSVQEQATSFTRDGGTFRVAETVPLKNPTITQTPPAHPSCLPGDALISTRGGIAATSKRVYVGDLIVVSTDQHRLRLTPNHPILTRHGWVAAGLLNVGDDLVGGSFGQGKVAGDMYNQNMPARIEEVTEAFRQSRLVTSSPVVVTAKDFHGDGEGSEVAVVDMDVLLRNHQQAAVSKPSEQHSLVFSDMPNPVGPSGLRRSDMFSDGRDTTEGGLMSGSGLGGTFCFAHARPLHRFSFGPSADRSSGFNKSSSDDGSADTEAVCQSLLGFAGQVSLNQIVDVEVVSFHGPVYNLETTTGYYIADGLVVHNCRCTVGLVILA